jgi:hypothetical protein
LVADPDLVGVDEKVLCDGQEQGVQDDVCAVSTVSEQSAKSARLVA